jgi:hypothetical protein
MFHYYPHTIATNVVNLLKRYCEALDMRKGRGGTRLSALQTCLAGAITLHWRTRASSGSAAPFCLLLLTVFLTMDLIREREGETGRRRAQTGEGERWGMRHHTRWRRRGGGRPVGGARNRDPAGRAARGRLQTHEVVAPMVVLVVREAPRRARGTHQSPVTAAATLRFWLW